VEPGDTTADAEAAVDKIAGLRVFPDQAGRMNLSLVDVAGEVLVIPQFTLLGDTRRGRRPSFTGAAAPGHAETVIAGMVDGFRDRGIVTAEGRFGETMSVDLVNEGPVTLILEFRDGRGA
jgi:D-tyrosyl-tRNA(Tyr) deacylase